MRSLRRPDAGFTLVELVLVVLITGIVAAIAVPRFAASVDRFRADTLARRIVADLESARQAARASSAAKTFTIDTAGNTYTLTGVPHPDRGDTTYIVALGEHAAAGFGYVDLGGDAELVFNGFGYPDSGGMIEIVVGTQIMTISVDPQTGRGTIP